MHYSLSLSLSLSLFPCMPSLRARDPALRTHAHQHTRTCTRARAHTHMHSKVPLSSGKSAAERPGARPRSDSESALAAGRARGEDSYFHKGHHNLSGLGPEYMIIKLGLCIWLSSWPQRTALAPAARKAEARWRWPGPVGWWSCQTTKNRRFRGRFGFQLRVRAACGSEFAWTRLSLRVGSLTTSLSW